MNLKYTEITRKRYNRVATIYDLMEGVVEQSRYSRWRQLLWSKVEGRKILEVGVGTGKNFPFYPKDADITAIDFSEKMLARAREKARKQDIKVTLTQMDIQKLEFPDFTFESVVSTFVFCSVPDPVLGLREVKRVCKSGGKIILLEHVLSANRILAGIMNLANPLVVRMMGANINRRTAQNVTISGLTVEKVTDLAAGIFKLIEARKQRDI
jgi:phosphatidylethanolamine/phosphatidyl-N-methylethanolamine N-methyltransferase